MTEWNNLKYTLMEEIGENMDIVLFRYFPTTKKFEWYIRNHADMDGTGAFCDVLAKVDGVEFTSQPMRSKPFVPNALQKLALAIKFWRLTRSPGPAWNPNIDFSTTGAADSFAFYTFSREATDKITGYCSPQGRSLTALALKCLDVVASQKLLQTPTARTWVIPTNMRGAVTDEFQLGNYSTSTLVRITNESSVEEIYASMRGFLDQGLHWGSWMFTNLPKYMSLQRYRKFVHGMGNAAFGSISNMGRGPTPEMVYPADSPPLDDYIWGGCPPSSKVVPLNSTSGIWAGRLTLTLKAHPSLKCDATQTSEMMRGWLHEFTTYIPDLQTDPENIELIRMETVYEQDV